jgi:hypothetical protein
VDGKIDDFMSRRSLIRVIPPETATQDRDNLLDQIYTNIPIVGSQVLEVPFSYHRALLVEV